MNSYQPPTDCSPAPRFRVGDVVNLGSAGLGDVERVTDCCTAVRLHREALTEFTTKLTEKKVSFKAKGELVRISNQSGIPILRRKAA
jgi:hypothetical protein